MTAVTLAIPAGSPPAAPKLTSEHWIHQQSHYQSCRATRRSLVHTDARAHAWPQTDHRNRFSPSFPRQAPPLNPHSARGTAGAPPPAISCLGAFRPPAARARGELRHWRQPKTCTTADITPVSRTVEDRTSWGG